MSQRVIKIIYLCQNCGAVRAFPGLAEFCAICRQSGRLYCVGIIQQSAPHEPWTLTHACYPTLSQPQAAMIARCVDSDSLEDP